MSEPIGRSTSPGDQETRQRLMEVASRLFAEHGFHHVTVRDICSQAEANLAAVNYHFRDKWGLYQEVLQPTIGFMKETFRLAHETDPAATPEERLRHYIRVVLHRVLGEEATCRHGRLMAREMVDPTPGLDLIIEQVIRPNSQRMHGLVSELMGCPETDPRIGLCVGSIQTQIFGQIDNPIIERLAPNLKYTSDVVDSLADHIADFSLGGIGAVAEHRVGVRT